MNKINIRNFTLVFLILLILLGCDKRTNDVKMMHKTVKDVVKSLEIRYKVQQIGFGEGGDKQFYHSIALSFNVFRVLDKKEGRKILIDSCEELLNAINSNHDLLPYLLPIPFTVLNLEVTLFSHHPNGQDIFYPNIFIFTVRSGKVMYKTELPEMKNKYGYHTEEEESYEEAKQIVHSQSKST